MLVSPCQATSRWPLGYRVHAQGHFDSAADYRAFIVRTIAELMPGQLPGDVPAGFDPEVIHLADPEHPRLQSRARALGLAAAGPAYPPVAELLAQGVHTPAQIMARLMDQGQSPLAVAAALEHFFDMGVLD